MKELIIAVVLFIMGISATQGQDQLVLKDSTTILCKVEEISERQVKYRIWSNLNGPSYLIERERVSHIIYQNRLIERFPKSEHVNYTILLRAGASLYNPVARDFASWGQREVSYSTIVQVSSFLDRNKRVSLTGTFYSIEARSRNIEDKGITGYLFAMGLNTKWDYHWRRWSSGSLYSGIGAGYFKTDYIYDSDSWTHGNISIPISRSRELESGIGFQLDILGLQYAPFRNVGVFVDLGIGYEGLCQTGLQIHW